ncbi:MAG: hypothetical protein K2O60_08320, partial [Ruminococcus sp.]|nr:hypothetical protein [Ruminococcus sp.]
PIYYRIYPFDRIKGYIRIIIDKQTLSPESISFHNKSRCDDISVKTKDNESYISIKGGEYGGYSFTIDIPEINKPVEVRVFQANWWNTTDFALTVNIDTVNNEVRYDYYFRNNDDKSAVMADRINNLDDEKLSVSFGL